MLQREVSQGQRSRGKNVSVTDTKSRKGRWLEFKIGVLWRIRVICDQ